MKMTKIKECNVSECAYNSEDLCHAMAVTIGHDSEHPMCDTFCQSGRKGGEKDIIAGVGACKVASCEYNQRLECHASSIKVGRQSDEVDCLTFQHR
jgi:hypothetical protein